MLASAAGFGDTPRQVRGAAALQPFLLFSKKSVGIYSIGEGFIIG